MTSLALTLVRGAVSSPFKRPRPDAPLPGARTDRVRVDVARLVAYERLCGFAAERGGGGGAGDDPLPVTYPHVLAFPQTMRLMAARDFPLPLLGLVHTSVEIVQHRAPLPGDELELTTYAAKLAPHRRGTEATVVTHAGVDGAPVWESRSTYLSRHRRPTDTTSVPAPPAEPLPARADWRLPEDLGRRYAAVSGDRNPIHLHPLTARPFGFPRAIAHGMWTFARCVAEHRREARTTTSSVDGTLYLAAEFRSPVLLPGVVTYAADGEAFELRGPSGRVHLRATTKAPHQLPHR
ncbi:MaoC/PaaZ C-terminal domain-containing protein [Streptomyces aurantiacus]|uniref:Putative Peroxisomal hydratase-dehydrogenase-epimerase n=1 Tax=Streptomyces aurantiacus JA 4570 TaxID=1286094 RepID=S3Z6Q4_9ACTN|nr:MaoC/PaaZ C-terminal domain-containing protein [Streptomyces aurantiacus]EPH39416.1 putative Peroxisomal hydratase-dehydrogenase-epimerase [Streptomyces aurantiacus JA 4570]